MRQLQPYLRCLGQPQRHCLLCCQRPPVTPAPQMKAQTVTMSWAELWNRPTPLLIGALRAQAPCQQGLMLALQQDSPPRGLRVAAGLENLLARTPVAYLPPQRSLAHWRLGPRM